ncbi:MAG: gamma-glutamyltransferase family protein [Phycisphaerales bacterium]
MNHNNLSDSNSQRFDWSLPYPSQREAVLARNIVATSQPLAAQAGLRMMQQGGNAIDAAVATAIALTVLEPTANGIGSDAFAIVWAGGGLHGLNASGRAPHALNLNDYAGMKEVPRVGWAGVTTPGAVSAWVALSEKFGSLPFETLVQPAIEYAERGYHVTRQNALGWQRGIETYRERPDWAATFAPKGKAPQPGEFVQLKDHARTLQSIARSKGEAFYRGELARLIATHAKETGGVLSERDLAQHEAFWSRPLAVDFHDCTLHELPPNGQGIIALIALGMLRHHRLDELDIDSPQSLHLQIEAMKLAFADGHRYVADVDAMDVDPATLVDPAYLESRSQMIDRNTAGDPQHGQPRLGGTVYLTTADNEGNMVSYIQSNYTGFGSGVVVPGTGIALQNRGCCFNLEDGHVNQIGPGKRPYHTIIPAFVTDRTAENDQPLMSFGVMGGFMQPQGHAQVLTRLAVARQNPQAAIDAPRFRVEAGRRVIIEPGFQPDVYDTLRGMGHDVEIAPERTVQHGGGQAIYRLDEHGWFGASDARRDGQAVGF